MVMGGNDIRVAISPVLADSQPMAVRCHAGFKASVQGSARRPVMEKAFSVLPRHGTAQLLPNSLVANCAVVECAASLWGFQGYAVPGQPLVLCLSAFRNDAWS